MGRLANVRMRLTTTFVRRVVVLTRALADASDAYPLPDGLRLAILGRDSGWTAYLQLRPDQQPTLPRERCARGDLCFAVLDGARMVHATWAATARAPLPYLDAEIALDQGDVCFYDSYTDPAWRGCSVSRSRDELCRRHYRDAGFARAVALIARENEAGLRTALPLGYRAIGTYGLLRLGPLRRRWSTSSDGGPLPRLVARACPNASP